MVSTGEAQWRKWWPPTQCELPNAPGLPPWVTGGGIPIKLDNRQIGTLFLSPPAGESGVRLPRLALRRLRGFLSAALALAAILLGLATFFSSRLSRPCAG